MSGRTKPNKGELIPSINRNLARKKSGLVKRGLELMSELNKQELKIGFADYQDGSIGKILCEVIRWEIGDKYNVMDRWSYYGDELLEFAETSAVDIFILNLNCITNYRELLGPRERLEYSYQVLTRIKTTYPTRLIIALSGWRNQAERAKLAGADFYFQYARPCFELKDFMEAIEKCLNMLPKFNGIQQKGSESKITRT